MKSILIFAIAAVLFASTTAYEDKYDDFDVDAFFANEAKVNAFFDCMMGQEATCDKDSQTFKELLPELIVTNCQKCTPKQKELFDKSNKLFLENYPDLYQQLVAQLAKRKEKQ